LEFISKIGGLPPLVPLNINKPMKKEIKVAKWKWENENLRNDSLSLYHWKKENTQINQTNLKMDNNINYILEYSDDEYEKYLKDLDNTWNKEETDYLWQLAKHFELRFIVIHDRYDSKYNRSLEEIKNRFHTITKEIIEKRKLTDHIFIKSNYNYFQEVKRKTIIEKCYSKSKEDIIKENEISEKAFDIKKKIENREKIENNIKMLKEDKKNEMTFEEYLKINSHINESFVYLQSQKINHLLPVSEKFQKKIKFLLTEFIFPERVVPTDRVEREYMNLKLSLIKLISLKTHYEKKIKEKETLEQILLSNVNQTVNNKITIPKANINININTQTLPGNNIIISNIDSKSSVINSPNKNVKKRKKNTENINLNNSVTIPNTISRTPSEISKKIPSKPIKRKANVSIDEPLDNSSKKWKKTNKKDDQKNMNIF